MKKHILIGTTPAGQAFATIQWADNRLSITGVIGPLENGDARGSCGQIDGTLRDHFERDELRAAPDLKTDDVSRLLEVWARWHLNDMRAGCEHQRAKWDTDKKLTVETYGLTNEAHRLRDKALAEARNAALENRSAVLDDAARFLIGPDWFKKLHQLPTEGDSRFGLFEKCKSEAKAAGWVYPSEHPEGLLKKPCPTCGYEYGSAWLHEDVPAGVIAFLESLPETDQLPAAWAR